MNTPQESDQVIQRRANLDALRALGVDVYPRQFPTDATISQVVEGYGARTGEQLEAEHVRHASAGSRGDAQQQRVDAGSVGVRQFGEVTDAKHDFHLRMAAAHFMIAYQRFGKAEMQRIENRINNEGTILGL